MATGSWDLTPRTVTDAQDEEDAMMTVLKCFRKRKVPISYAINKSFPFLEALRDRELITNKMYEDCQDSFKSLVPVNQVIYKVLNELEKKFDMEVLDALFSEINRMEYPDLKNIYKDFQNVIQEKLCFLESDGEEREERPTTQLQLEEGTGGSSVSRSLPWPCSEPSSPDGATLPENGLTHRPRKREQVNGLRTQATRESNGAPGSDQTPWQTAHKSALGESCEEAAAPVSNGDASTEPPSPSSCDEEKTEKHTEGFQVGSCSVVLVDIKKEKPFYSEEEKQALTRRKSSQASDIIVISSDDSGGLSDEDETPTTSRSAQRSRPELSKHDPLESSEDEESQEATGSHQIKGKPEDFRDSPTFRKSPLKRGRQHVSDSSSSSDEETLPVFKFWQRSQLRGLSNGGSAEVNPREECSEALRSGSECVSGGQEARMASGHTSGMTDAACVGNQSTSGNDIGRSRKRKRHTCKIKPLQKRKKKYRNSHHSASRSSDLLPGRKRGRPRVLSTGAPRKRGWPKGKKRSNIKCLKRVRKRGPRICKEAHVNFHVPELPVTCGSAKGTLIKELFKQGVWKKSIHSEDGRCFTPREFEIEGNHALSKNWKLSLRSHGWTLKELLEKGFLPKPPSKKQRTPAPPINIPEDPYPENSNECKVCSQGGQLYCCDTCPKSYHEDCHIPPVDTKRDPWSCTFCETAAIRKRCRDSQRCLQESEVLMKETSDEQQLKCELLLLKVYCYVIKAATLSQQEHKDLQMVKIRLREQKYFRVKEFVQDIRLILQSHKASNRNKRASRLALCLEAKFEKNFKNIFGIKETTPNNDPLSCLGPFSS